MSETTLRSIKTFGLVLAGAAGVLAGNWVMELKTLSTASKLDRLIDIQIDIQKTNDLRHAQVVSLIREHHQIMFKKVAEHDAATNLNGPTIGTNIIPARVTAADTRTDSAPPPNATQKALPTDHP